jgi:hypothetical protein
MVWVVFLWSLVGVQVFLNIITEWSNPVVLVCLGVNVACSLLETVIHTTRI